MDNRDAILLRIPPALHEQVSELARVNKRSTTREIELAIERHVSPASGIEAPRQ
jgi:hypothetical protein